MYIQLSFFKEPPYYKLFQFPIFNPCLCNSSHPCKRLIHSCHYVVGLLSFYCSINLISITNLHCTSRLALALTVGFNPLSAKHQYLPEWFLLASTLSVFPWVTVFPLLIQAIFGTGFPMALQLNVARPPSSTVWFVGRTVMLGATVNRINNQWIIIKCWRRLKHEARRQLTKRK